MVAWSYNFGSLLIRSYIHNERFPVTERILSLERAMICVQTTSNTEDNVSKIPTVYLKGYSCGEDDRSISRHKRKAPMDKPAIPKTLRKRKTESESTVIESTNLYHINSKQLL